MRISRILLLLMFPALLPSVAGAGFKEQRLGLIPSGYQLDHSNIFFTRDGSKVAFAARLGNTSCVVFGDKIGKPYSHVRHISISPDGRSVVIVLAKSRELSHN